MEEVGSVSAKSEVKARIVRVEQVRVEQVRVAEGDDAAPVGGERYYFDAVISNGSVDSYYTHMSERTLLNFAAALSVGVSMQDSHSTYRLGVAYSDGGRYEVDENGVGRVIGRFYTVRGLTFGGGYSYATSDDFIRAIEAGLVRDVSVGFHDGTWTCDICHLNYFYDWSQPDTPMCRHIAGLEYVTDEEPPRRVVCTVEIDNANLSEVSLVYDGATPGAVIIKARDVAESGDLSPAAAAALERQFRVRLPAAHLKKGVPMNTSRRDVAAADAAILDVEEQEDEEIEPEPTPEVEVESPSEADDVPEEEEAVALDLAEVERVMRGIGRADVGMTERIVALATEFRRLRKENARLASDAAMGRQYRDDLIQETLERGVAAQGSAFPSEQYRSLLASADVEAIKAVRDSFTAARAERLPVGRQSAGAVAPPLRESEEIPAVAYSG